MVTLWYWAGKASWFKRVPRLHPLVFLTTVIWKRDDRMVEVVAWNQV